MCVCVCVCVCVCAYIYHSRHPQTDLFRSIRTHHCG